MSKLVDGVYIIEQEKSILCELCGEIKETRPVGVNNSNICYECAHKPEYIEEATKKLKNLINNSKFVIIR